MALLLLYCKTGTRVVEARRARGVVEVEGTIEAEPLQSIQRQRQADAALRKPFNERHWLQAAMA